MASAAAPVVLRKVRRETRHRLILGCGLAGCACETLIELFVVRSSVDVDLPGGKIKRHHILLPLENDSFGSAISFESQQIGKTGSIKQSRNPERLGVGRCDDRLASCQAKLDELREHGRSYERLIAREQKRGINIGSEIHRMAGTDND